MIYKPDSYLYRQATQDGSAVLQSDFATDYIFRGLTFSVDHVINDLINGTVYLLFSAGGENATVAIPPSFSSTQGPLTIAYIANHDYTGGTPLVSYNRNTQSIVAPTSTLSINPTGTTVGAHFSDILVGSSNLGAATGAGSYTDDDLFVLSPGDKILIQITNHSGAVVDFFSITTKWYEY